MADAGFEVPYDEMTFFTHRIDGEMYGAWYRQLSSGELEIIGAGFMCRAAYGGYDELSVVRSVLEDQVRGRKVAGSFPKSLEQQDAAQAGRAEHSPRQDATGYTASA